MMQDYCKSAVSADTARGWRECGRVLRTDGKCDNPAHDKGRKKERKSA